MKKVKGSEAYIEMLYTEVELDAWRAGVTLLYAVHFK